MRSNKDLHKEPSSTNKLRMMLLRVILHRYFLLAVITLAIIPYLGISVFIHPSGDDFTYAWTSWQNNFTDALLREYLQWNGRYSSNIFVLLNPIAFGSFAWYKVMPTILLVFSFIATYLFISALTKQSALPIHILSADALFHLLYLNGMPDLSEGIYWYTAAVTYHLGACVFLLFIALWVKYVRKVFVGTRLFHLSAILLVLFFAVGFNEVLMLIALAFAAFTMFLSWRHLWWWRHFSIIVFCTACLAAACMFFAPGNSVRSSLFPHENKLFYSIAMATAQTARFLSNWLNSLALALISVAYVQINKQLSAQLAVFRNSFYLTPLTASCIVLFLVFMGSFPAYFATGIQGQHRTVNLVYFFFLPVWFMFLTVMYNRFVHLQAELPKTINQIAIVIGVVLLALTNNSYNVIDDIQSGRAKVFDETMTNRYDQLMQNSDTVRFKSIEFIPKSIFVYDVVADHGHWKNTAYSTYFTNGKTVVLKE